MFFLTFNVISTSVNGYVNDFHFERVEQVMSLNGTDLVSSLSRDGTHDTYVDRRVAPGKLLKIDCGNRNYSQVDRRLIHGGSNRVMFLQGTSRFNRRLIRPLLTLSRLAASQMVNTGRAGSQIRRRRPMISKLFYGLNDGRHCRVRLVLHVRHTNVGGVVRKFVKVGSGSHDGILWSFQAADG